VIKKLVGPHFGRFFFTRSSGRTDNLINGLFSALKDEAARQSYMLFVICGLFLTCHILRLVLAIHELVSRGTRGEFLKRIFEPTE
jgi:hypothetical protein